MQESTPSELEEQFLRDIDSPLAPLISGAAANLVFLPPILDRLVSKDGPE